MANSLTLKEAVICADRAGDTFYGRYIYTPITIHDLHIYSSLASSATSSDFDDTYPVGSLFEPNDGIDFNGDKFFTKGVALGFSAGPGKLKPGQGLMTFRGTLNAKEASLIDLSAGYARSPRGYAVHGGFLRLFNSCMEDVWRAFRAMPNIHTLHITGHSMGGALATLAAEMLSGRGKTIKLYTFGAPRVGLRRHAKFLTEELGPGNLYRYYFNNDPVTWLPPFPYWHMPGKRLAGGKGRHRGYFKPGIREIAGGSTGTGNATTGGSLHPAARLLLEFGRVAGGILGVANYPLFTGIERLSEAVYQKGRAVAPAIPRSSRDKPESVYRE